VSAAVAQTVSTTLRGTVKDPSEAVISGAKITLIDNATKRQVTSTTDDEGAYLFTDVSAGNYTIIAEHPSFKKGEVTEIKVDVGVPATVNVVLEVGAVTETITVTASEAQQVINSQNAELQSTVQQQQIVDLPLNGRNPISLAGLQAGVATNLDTRSAAVNGLRGSFTNLTWDGININDNYIRTDSFFAVAVPAVEGVAEFTLTTQNAGPNVGLGVGQAALITPRGSSEFHGGLFWFHRNDVFDANSFFNNAAGRRTADDPLVQAGLANTGEEVLPKNKLIRNQFGFSVGGPVPLSYFKDKLFFYTYYQGTRERRADSITRTSLTAQARQGLFTYRRGDNGRLQTVNLLNLGGASTDETTSRLLGLTPLPNDFTEGDGLNFAGFRFNSGVIEDDNLFGLRFDYNLSARHKFEAVYSRYTLDSPNDTFNDIGEPFPGLPGAGQSSTRPRGSFAWLWTPTSRLTNELRFGFNNYDVKFVTRETFADGFRLNFPGIITNPIQNALPQGRPVNVYEVIDNSSFAKGNHLISFGGNYRNVLAKPFNDGGIIPTYTIGFNTTGNPNPLSPDLFPGGIGDEDFGNAPDILASLGGFLDNGVQTFNSIDRNSGFVDGATNVREFQYYTVGLYAGDSWRFRPNLSINAGLRWEFISVPTERNGLTLLPVGGLEALNDPNAVIDFAGSGTGRKFFGNDWNNFAPSISFAWDPWNDGKTSIRGGFSISYAIDSNITTIENATNGNDGLTQNITINEIAGTVSGGGIAPIPTPQFLVPRTLPQSIALDPFAAIFTIDPNLKTPYVQQWNVGVQRELFSDTVVEARYVGNHAIKLARGVDINQVKIFENGFLDDFLRAQRNLRRNDDPEIGEPLRIFPLLGLGGGLFDEGIRGLIRTGEVAELASTYVQLRDLILTPGVFGGQLDPSFFLNNPNAFVADYIGNGSFSNYHALQTEVRRRWKNGLYLQANYTFSKAFTDFEGTENNFSGLLDNFAGTALEKKRASFDVTHVFNANWVYELPFGPNHRFLSRGLTSKVLGGWTVGGIWQWRSGRPISIISQRGTLNRASGLRSDKNTVDTTLGIDELSEKTGVFRDSQGRILLFDPSLIGPDGRANTSFFSNPGAGTAGSLQLTPVSGPRYFNMDINLMKRFFINERMNVEFRAEAFNVWNNVNFFVGENHNINDTAFGQISQSFDPRILQFALKFTF
jgi:hypothetical protein